MFNKYYEAIFGLIATFYRDKEDLWGHMRLGQYVLNNMSGDHRREMFPLADGLETDSYIYYETNNAKAAQLLTDKAIEMGEDQ